ncbi:hypothetical protein, partial [Streptomyces sp. NPDC001919]
MAPRATRRTMRCCCGVSSRGAPGPAAPPEAPPVAVPDDAPEMGVEDRGGVLVHDVALRLAHGVLEA